MVLPRHWRPWLFGALAFVGVGVMRWPLLWVMGALAPWARRRGLEREGVMDRDRPQRAVSPFFGPLVRGRRRSVGDPARHPPLRGGSAPPDDERRVCRDLHVGPGGAWPQLHVRHAYRLACGWVGGRSRDDDPTSRAGYHAFVACRAL